MQIDCLSVKNPLSYLICMGIKTVENRDWKIETPRELYIHSSGKPLDFFLVEDYAPDAYADQYANLVHGRPVDKLYLNSVKKMDAIFDLLIKHYEQRNEPYFLSQTIIGKITVSEIKENYSDIWSDGSRYQWILTNPVLFSTPIQFVKGQLKIFKFDLEDIWQKELAMEKFVEK